MVEGTVSHISLMVLVHCSILPLKVKFTQSCLTLCDLMVYTVCGILQARILKWVAFSLSRESSQPRDWNQTSRIAGGFFISWATGEGPLPFHLQNQICNTYKTRSIMQFAYISSIIKYHLIVEIVEMEYKTVFVW